MKVIARPFSKTEKADMIKVVDKIHDMLRTLESPMQEAFVTKLVNQAVQDDLGIAKVATIDKAGKLVDLGDKVNRTRVIIEGMDKSNCNLILFRDEYKVWMQYYIGKFLGKPTLIICKDEDREILKHFEVEDELLIVEDYNNIDCKEMEKNIMKVMKNG